MKRMNGASRRTRSAQASLDASQVWFAEGPKLTFRDVDDRSEQEPPVLQLFEAHQLPGSLSPNADLTALPDAFDLGLHDGMIWGHAHHSPLLGMDSQGSQSGKASPACKSSIEMLSGERTKAIRPSLGGRLTVMPAAISRAQVA